jgi:AraC family transcriptional regulator, transcriptional activator of pobA
MVFKGKQNALFSILETDSLEALKSETTSYTGLMVLWILEAEISLTVEGIPYRMGPDKLLFISDFNDYSIEAMGLVRLIKFNRAFFCIIDSDTEVGCKGLLFLNSKGQSVINLNEVYRNRIAGLWSVFIQEIRSEDDLQESMLQMLLKRLLIICTRIYREQNLHQSGLSGIETIRQFQFLVEQNFRKQHNVSFYSDLLNKSPKTLSNLFALSKNKSPKEIIDDRLYLEACKVLRYTSKSVKEIGFELGFEDLANFSRFFRNKAGIAPREYRLELSEKKYSGIIDN